MNKFKEIIFWPLFNLKIRLSIYDELRFIFLRLAGANIKGRSVFYARMTFRPFGGLNKLSIGRGCFINEGVRFSLAKSKISIGNECLIGPNVSFECAGHGLVHKPIVGRGLISKDIEIGDRCWISADVTILGGVTIGSDVVVGAKSLVTKSLDSGFLYCGIPAKKIRILTTSDEIG
uniref:acyltransferase n=1 Tax=Marinobacterium profundum TaxID=1714300 RepID=UPI0009E862F6|nr:acyltransferase [Marinobacterium profundum]